MAHGSKGLSEILRVLNQPSAEPKRARTPQIEHWRKYLTLELVTGAKASPTALKAIFRQRHWASTFVRIATVGAMIGNRSAGAFDEEVRTLTLGPLLASRDAARPLTTMIADGVEFFGKDAATAHEHAIYFLEALAILEGSDAGEPITEPELAFAFLLANDYLTRWLEEDARPLSDEELVIAELSPLTRLNMQRDVLRSIARSAVMLAERPPRGRLSRPGVWEEVQRSAFGENFSSYLSLYAAPLVIMSTTWGFRANGALIQPTLEPETWFSQTKLPISLGAAFLGSLSVSREQARKDLQTTLDSDGLPRSVAVFYRTPLIRISESTVAAATPAALREQLRGGCWARYRAAVAATEKSEVWLYAFGDLVELWCRRVARAAAKRPRFKAELLQSDTIGDAAEIEDVTIRDGRAAILFSVKSSFMAENLSRVFRSRTAVLDWYERFFFFNAGSEFRGGAVRLLDGKIQKIRAGETPLASDTWIYPVVVTIDDVGEQGLLYRFLSRRCEEEGLLRDTRVGSLTVMSVDRYELLMAHAARGGSLSAFFQKKSSQRWREMRTEELLFDITGNLLKLRLPEIEDAFSTVASNVIAGLFEPPAGKSRPHRSPRRDSL